MALKSVYSEGVFKWFQKLFEIRDVKTAWFSV